VNGWARPVSQFGADRQKLKNSKIRKPSTVPRSVAVQSSYFIAINTQRDLYIKTKLNKIIIKVKSWWFIYTSKKEQREKERKKKRKRKQRKGRERRTTNQSNERNNKVNSISIHFIQSVSQFFQFYLSFFLPSGCSCR
jgi:hypothetical protein